MNAFYSLKGEEQRRREKRNFIVFVVKIKNKKKINRKKTENTKKKKNLRKSFPKLSRMSLGSQQNSEIYFEVKEHSFPSFVKGVGQEDPTNTDFRS